MRKHNLWPQAAGALIFTLVPRSVVTVKFTRPGSPAITGKSL